MTASVRKILYPAWRRLSKEGRFRPGMAATVTTEPLSGLITLQDIAQLLGTSATQLKFLLYARRESYATPSSPSPSGAAASAPSWPRVKT